MSLINYLKNYFRKESTNQNSVEDWILKSEIDSNDITKAWSM